MRTINVSLDSASIQSAIAEIAVYRQELNSKSEQLRKRIAELLKDAAQEGFNSAIADDLTQASGGAVMSSVEVITQDDGNLSVVVANGKDAVFIEFGAGVHHNGSVGASPNPWGTRLGYTIGGYGNGKGKRDKWALPGRKGRAAKWSYGTPAQMPLYNAVQRVQDQIEAVAKEVFGS